MNFINFSVTMKRFIFFSSLFLVAFLTATAQNFPVDTARINKAYRALEEGTRTLKTEMEFLDAFPTTWLEFYLTYGCLSDDSNDYIMCRMCNRHINTLFGLSQINDTLLCEKIVNIAVGMKESNDCTSIFQELLVNYILQHENTVLHYLSKLRKGHQMEFWQFCWSTVTECNWKEVFWELYNRNKDAFPEQMEISRTAFNYFYNGINYPELLPHNEEEYRRRYEDKNFRYRFNGYMDWSYK